MHGGDLSPSQRNPFPYADDRFEAPPGWARLTAASSEPADWPCSNRRHPGTCALMSALKTRPWLEWRR